MSTTTLPDGILIEPGHDGSLNTRVALVVDGEVVSWTAVVPMKIHIGEAIVRMDGIGGVETLEAHRNRGYSRQVLTAAVEHMKAGDASLTTLYGIPNYYPRWGYATVGHESRIRISRLDTDNELLPGYRMRAAKPSDIGRIRTIYDDSVRMWVSALQRDDTTPSWRTLAASLASQDDECRVIVDETDEVLAYAWRSSTSWWIVSKQKRDPDGLHIGEAFAETPRTADALLAGIRQWASELGRQHVVLHQPAIGPVGMSVRLQSSENLIETARDAEFMGRSVGVVALFQALEPVLSRRWMDARTTWSGTLSIQTGEDAVSLALGEDTLVVTEQVAEDATIVEVSPGDVARLVFGTFPPLDLLDRIGIARDIADILAILFPEQHPYVLPADRF